jgi:molybdopterin-dependent oxidoreductase alpha subunit
VMQDDSKKSRSAGGWSALESVAKTLLASGAPLKGARSLLSLNQDHGFDCPGCAWGDPEHASSFEFCENGVKAVAWEATSKIVTAGFFAAHTVEELKMQDGHFLESQGRLVTPMRYGAASDTYKPIEWEDAFALIGTKLNALSHPDEALFYTSGRTSNEAAFLYQLFAREFGTNNLPDCSNMCHEASGIALKEQIGTGKGTILLDDFTHAEAIFIFGQNPGTNHPRMLVDLRNAARRGAKIVVFNPLRERGLERFAHPKSPRDMLGGGVNLATNYYRPRIGGDMAAVKGMMKVMLDAHRNGNEWAIDRAFIDEHTTGFDTLTADLDRISWPDIEQRSGLTREEIEEAANIYMQSPRTIFTWAMGLTQHRHSVVTIQTLMDMLLLRGNIGRPGTGPCPVRGHSNVQGDRTMGITEFPAPEFLDALEREFEISMPHKHGLGTVEAIQAMQEGRCKVFIGLGGNFAAAAPDTEVTEAALEKCELTVHVSTKLNRSHLVHGKEALILPCLGRTEIDIQDSGPQLISVEDSMSMVHGSGGLNRPVSSKLRSEPSIIAGIAKATLPKSKVPWDAFITDYRHIRERIARVIPGFEDFNTRLGKRGGFHLGNSARERDWETESGKARFMANPLPSDDGTSAFTLMTIRSHDQYNTSIYGYDDRYRGIKGERRVVFINADDLAELGLAPDEHVTLRAESRDGKRREAHGFRLQPYDIPRGCLAAYYPETNVLVALDSFGERSGTPTSKSIPVTLIRA